MKWEFCEGCPYDVEQKEDDGCELFIERPFMCDRRKCTHADKIAIEQAIKEHHENKMLKSKTMLYTSFSGACGKYCQNT